MDIREKAAKYYDLWPPPFDDVPFYKERIPSREASVLEFGCGTGRVLVPLVDSCLHIHGTDISRSMVDICREKMMQAGIPSDRSTIEVGDITDFHLGRRFDLIIAPYRVFQNLETNEQVDCMLKCVREHLETDGCCILNVFHPWPEDRICQAWGSEVEYFCWEVPLDEGRLTCHERRQRIDLTNQILYPEAIYRRYEDDRLVDEVTLKITMRYYYPDQFEKIITDHGFTIVERWGGYNGEPYGGGQELVVQFKGSV